MRAVDQVPFLHATLVEIPHPLVDHVINVLPVEEVAQRKNPAHRHRESWPCIELNSGLP